MGGALARPSWLSSPTLGRANRFLSTAAVSLMTPRRPLAPPEKVKIRTLAVEQRTEEDSESLLYFKAFSSILLSPNLNGHVTGFGEPPSPITRLERVDIELFNTQQRSLLEVN